MDLLLPLMKCSRGQGLDELMFGTNSQKLSEPTEHFADFFWGEVNHKPVLNHERRQCYNYPFLLIILAMNFPFTFCFFTEYFKLDVICVKNKTKIDPYLPTRTG
jgi:hypothetical protein